MRHPNRRSIALLSVCLLALAAATSAGASVSLDRFSPTLSTLLCGGSPADVYHNVAPGTGGCDVGGAPVLDIPPGDYGLVANDNNNGHSNNEASPSAQQLLLFSGDGGSAGLPGTPFRNQAVRNQAMGDVFRTVNAPSAPPSGVIAAGVCGAAATLAGGHVLNNNQTHHNLIPTIAPPAFNGFVPPAGFAAADNVDALEIGGFDLSGDQVHDLSVYFVLDPASPSIGGGSAADIFLSMPGGVTFYRYARAAWLGLSAQDDVDALVMWDRVQIGGVDAGQDYALFSLAPGSPALAGPDGVVGTADDYSAADVFVTDFSGTFCLYVVHNQLGLRFQDNLNALDVIVLD